MYHYNENYTHCPQCKQNTFKHFVYDWNNNPEHRSGEPFCNLKHFGKCENVQCLYDFMIPSSIKLALTSYKKALNQYLSKEQDSIGNIKRPKIPTQYITVPKPNVEEKIDTFHKFKKSDDETINYWI